MPQVPNILLPNNTMMLNRHTIMLLIACSHFYNWTKYKCLVRPTNWKTKRWEELGFKTKLFKHLAKLMMDHTIWNFSPLNINLHPCFTLPNTKLLYSSKESNLEGTGTQKTPLQHFNECPTTKICPLFYSLNENSSFHWS